MKRGIGLTKIVLALLLFTVTSLIAAEEEKYIACAPFEVPYFAIWHEGARAAAKHLRIKLITATANWDPSRERTLIESSVAGGANGVIVARVDLDAFVPYAEELFKRGVPVVTTDGPFHRGPRLAHFSSDDVSIGKIQAKKMLQALEQSGKPKPWKLVIFAGAPGTYAGTLRPDGALSELRPYINKGEVQIIYEIANFSRSEALTKMQAILARGPVDGVIAANDDMAIGALNACKMAGLKPGKDVFFIGVDIIPEAAELIKTGEYLGSVTQAPWLEGYWAVATIYFFRKYGGKPDSVAMPVPYFLVDKTNLDTYEQYVKYDGPPPVDFFTNCSDKYREFVNAYWPNFQWPEWSH